MGAAGKGQGSMNGHGGAGAGVSPAALGQGNSDRAGPGCPCSWGAPQAHQGDGSIPPSAAASPLGKEPVCTGTGNPQPPPGVTPTRRAPLWGPAPSLPSDPALPRALPSTTTLIPPAAKWPHGVSGESPPPGQLLCALRPAPPSQSPAGPVAPALSRPRGSSEHGAGGAGDGLLGCSSSNSARPRSGFPPGCGAASPKGSPRAAGSARGNVGLGWGRERVNTGGVAPGPCGD
ncbi:unnamed protein product [Lepidochelys kempii]